MKTKSYLTGNIIFDGNPKVAKTATLKLLIEDVTINNEPDLVYEKMVDFDHDSIAIFKYLPFELKDFEHDPTRRYALKAHVDMNNNGKVEDGDYVSDSPAPIVTGMEELDLQLTKA